MVDLEIVELVDFNDSNGKLDFVAEIEKWREKEYKEKWFSEFEIKYSFPIHFPTGFRISPGFREKLRNWQCLSYVKPYERMQNFQICSCGGLQRYENRAVGIIHELLCLTVEKMVAVEQLVHFRKDLGIEVNLPELLLKYPGIFYMSTQGNTQTVFLRELRAQIEVEEESKNARNNKNRSETRNGSQLEGLEQMKPLKLRHSCSGFETMPSLCGQNHVGCRIQVSFLVTRRLAEVHC